MVRSIRTGALISVFLTAATVLAGSVAAAAPGAAAPGAAVTARAGGPTTGPGTGIAPDTQFTPLVSSVLTTPMPVLGSDGRQHLAYELTLTNIAGFPLDVRVVKVKDPARKSVLLDLRGVALRTMMRTIDTASVDTPGVTTIAPAQTSIVYLDVALPRRATPPRHLVHQVVAVGAPGGTPHDFTMTLTSTAVSRRGPVVLHSPLQSGRWLASEGCCTDFTHHRWGTVAVNGTLGVPQRFAIDFFRLDGRNRTWIGDPSDVHSYLSYGQKVLAAAPGRVVAVVDAYPNQRPPQPPPVTPIQDSVGNHVILKVAPGVFLLYAHMKPGSVRVRVGQRLRVGQTIGLVGTSGNSTTPHLHFQVLTRRTFFPSDSIPYVFDRFRLVGQETARIWDDNVGLQPNGTIPVGPVTDPGPRRRALPLDRSVIVLP